jgi:phosphonate utilization transcriptional regulator
MSVPVPALSELEILQSKSLPMVVQEAILRLILEGKLEAGQKLTEADLATRLGVSRGPIREAFRGLEEAGLVQLSKHRGVFVREITADEAEELYAVRAGLDELAGRLLAPRIRDVELAELQALVEDMEDSFLRQDTAVYFPRNIRFHDRIVELAGNRKLLGIYRRVMNEMHLMRRQGIVRGGGILVSNHEHREIVAALATRDGDEAARVMRAHVTAGRQRLLNLLARGEGVQ